MSFGRTGLGRAFRASSEVTSSIHQNVSRGYTQIAPDGTRTFVEYKAEEFSDIHTFITPSIARKKHMKWTKTRRWQDRDKAAKSKWKYTPTFGGLNTVSK